MQYNGNNEEFLEESTNKSAININNKENYTEDTSNQVNNTLDIYSEIDNYLEVNNHNINKLILTPKFIHYDNIILSYIYDKDININIYTLIQNYNNNHISRPLGSLNYLLLELALMNKISVSQMREVTFEKLNLFIDFLYNSGIIDHGNIRSRIISLVDFYKNDIINYSIQELNDEGIRDFEGEIYLKVYYHSKYYSKSYEKTLLETINNTSFRNSEILADILVTENIEANIIILSNYINDNFFTETIEDELSKLNKEQITTLKGQLNRVGKSNLEKYLDK